MHIGFIVYTGMTSLDFMEFTDPLTRLKIMGLMPVQSEICTYAEEVSDHKEKRQRLTPMPTVNYSSFARRLSSKEL